MNAFDFCLSSPLDSTVDERGCSTDDVASSDDSQEEGIGLATLVFLLAGAVIVYAVYTNTKRPGPPLPKTPAGFEP